jgi:hypothetical protein
MGQDSGNETHSRGQRKRTSLKVPVCRELRHIVLNYQVMSSARRIREESMNPPLTRVSLAALYIFLLIGPARLSAFIRPGRSLTLENSAEDIGQIQEVLLSITTGKHEMHTISGRPNSCLEKFKISLQKSSMECMQLMLMTASSCNG